VTSRAIDGPDAVRHEVYSMCLVERRRAQLGMTLLLFAEKKTLRERRPLVRNAGLLADQRDGFLETLGTERCGGLESALPSANDDDRHLLLRRGRVNHEAVQLRLDVDLAAQAAVGFPGRGGGFEHRVLILADGVEQGEELFLDVDVAGGALAVAAAFGDDAVHVVLYGAFHDGVAEGNVNRARGSGI